MAGDFKAASHQAIEDFERLVAPVFIGRFGGSFISTELSSNPVCQALDIVAGIDCIHQGDAGLQGVALRIQRGERNWRTFTVREARESGAFTEMDKRRAAIKGGCLYPVKTIQAYVHQGRLLGMAVARTRDLYDLAFIEAHGVRRLTDDDEGRAFFVALAWDCLLGADKPLVEHDGEGWLAPTRALCPHYWAA